MQIGSQSRGDGPRLPFISRDNAVGASARDVWLDTSQTKQYAGGRGEEEEEEEEKRGHQRANPGTVTANAGSLKRPPGLGIQYEPLRAAEKGQI